MWRLISKPQTLKVTRALAKEYSEMTPPPHERPLSEMRLSVYRGLLAKGLFRPVTWSKATCLETGTLCRINGQHTSTMLASREEMPEFYVTLEHYECDTIDDVARLYSTFDSKLQSRTARDIYLAFAGTIIELATLPVKTITLAVSGMDYHIGTPGKSYGSTAAERAERLLEYPEFVLWLNGILSPNSDTMSGRSGKKAAEHLLRYPVVAAIFGTWQKSKTQSREFWEAVRDETGATPGTPDRKLARFLLTTGFAGGGGSRRIKTSSPREMYVKCLHAWNAWRKGEATNLNYHADKDVPSIK